MARTPRPNDRRRRARWITSAGVAVVVTGALSLALPFMAVLAPDAPLPSPAVATAADEVRLDKHSVPVRILVPFAGIDLPIVSSQKNVPGNVRGYPLCDVAQYWTKYDLPGAPGTAWIFGHAQEDMFLPLFTISESTDGKGLIGKIIQLQLKDGRVLRYRITEVKERSRNQNIAKRDRDNEQRLVLQTSTGPPGTIPKLQVAAKLVGATTTDEKAPKAVPRACWQPKPKPTPKNRKATPSPEPVIEPESGEISAEVLVLGSVAVLLGATLIAVYLARREP